MKKYRIYIVIIAMMVMVLSGYNGVHAYSNEDGDIVTLPGSTDDAGDTGYFDIPITTKEPEETTISVGGPISAEAISKAKKLKTKVISATKSKKKAKKAKIVLKKIKNASGYQIKYSTSKKFKKAKTKFFKKNKFTLKKLKPGKKYYVKARTYVKFCAKKVYGKWSKANKIKVKNK